MTVLHHHRCAAWRLVAAALAVLALAAPAAAQTSSPVTGGWRDGFVLQDQDGSFRLQVGLLLQADGRFAAGDEAEALADTFLLRRVRPTLRGRFTRRFEFYLNPDFAGGTLVVQDAYLDTVFSPAFKVRVGKAKSPFGLERLHSAANLLFYERALPTALVPNRDVGVQVLGDLRGGLVSYAAGVLNGVADGASADVDTGDGKDLVGRVAVRPFARHGASPLRGLGLAIAGSRGRQNGPASLPAFRTTSLQQPYFSYGGVQADGVRVRYSPQVFFSSGRLGALGEFVRSEGGVRRDGVRVTIPHTAWQIAASYFLTGESDGEPGSSIRPRRSFGSGGWGALQAAARYHRLAVDAAARTLGFAAPGSTLRVEAWTAGLNWVLTSQVKYVLNVERSVFDTGTVGSRPPETAIVFRAQLNF